MSTDKKIIVIKGIILLVVLAIIIAGISGVFIKSEKESGKVGDIAEKANDVAYIFNTRYNPNEVDEERLREICDDDTFGKVMNVLSQIDTDSFISLEDQFTVYENNIVLEEDGLGNIIEVNLSDVNDNDYSIIDVNGVRGVRIHDVYVKDNGKFDIRICGNDIEVEVPEGKLLGTMIKNPKYYLKPLNYNYYDDGTFIVNLVSDADSAFENDIRHKLEIDENVIMEGDIGVLMREIQNTDGKIGVPQEVYEIIKEDISNYFNGVNITVKCRIDNNKISDISMDIFKAL